MQQVISVGNQDFKSIRERAGKVIRILKLSWKICFIEEKHYDAQLLAKGMKKEKIRHYGFAFCGKKVLIGK